ncbi:hypothetical protein BT96DRAFT_994015 [Gymnopus androsaceus JB14]|uniref:Uncharacterized protein n=1 Tax=Gymnopus androsaceus JB14 TaxID=1447944 RepID=A0A6A4HMU5_9AGAR|nr:hypothetical protein BT96DRAFT_994015 [Gymnopus androsaceus JB14]
MANASAGRESSVSLITAFVTMHTFAWICCSIIIITVILCPGKIHRQSTWINLNFSWIVACFIFAFLLTTGQLFKADPDPSICTFQAAAVNTVPSLIAGTMLAFTLQLWFNIHLNPNRTATIMSPRNRDKLLIIVPYVVPFIEFFASLGYALQNPHQVSLTDSGMFCGITNPIPGQFSAIYSALLMIPTLFVQGILSLYIYRNWYRFTANNRNTLGIIVRLAMFTFFGVIGIVVSLINLASPANSSEANILESLPPISFVFIFGFQEDIFRVWMFWRPSGRGDNTRSRAPRNEIHSQSQSYSSDIELGSDSSFERDEIDMEGECDYDG